MYPFTITINGNTPEELYSNLEKLSAANGGATPTAPQFETASQQQPANPAPMVNSTPFATPPMDAPMSNTSAAAPMTPQPPTVAPPAPDAATAPMPPAQTGMTQPPAAPAANPTPPTAAPTYTIEVLARAGAALAQTPGKMPDALALLAKYGVQTINQLRPEQFGAFATDLRALGAQV